VPLLVELEDITDGLHGAEVSPLQRVENIGIPGVKALLVAPVLVTFHPVLRLVNTFGLAIEPFNPY